MGLPKVSRAMLTISMARTTPAQKPRGLSKRIFFIGEPDSVSHNWTGKRKLYVKSCLLCKLLLPQKLGGIPEHFSTRLFWLLVLRRSAATKETLTVDAL